MPPRQPRIPVTTGIPKSAFQFSSDSWLRVEKTYRKQIPSDVRDRIEEATRDYLWLLESEQKAAPMADASDEISATRKAAQALVERLTAIHDCKSDVHSFVGHLISQRLKLSTRWPLSDHLADLIRGLELLASALSEMDADGARQSALAETADARVERNGTAIPMSRETAKSYASAAYKAKAVALQSGGTQKEGDAWRGWVRKLQVILRQSNLPAGTSKSANYPLVRLVDAIQNELPKDRKISGRFLGSLADGIYQAVRSPAD
jgi:hypothetical protein